MATLALCSLLKTLSLPSSRDLLVIGINAYETHASAQLTAPIQACKTCPEIIANPALIRLMIAISTKNLGKILRKKGPA